jgi:hypothetical protein
MKKSIEEVILKEYKLKFKDYFLNRRQIIKKNNIYFKEIMKEFYKINFDSSEKYYIFMRDPDVINIFQRQEKEKEKLNAKNQVNKVKEKNVYNLVKLTKINNNTNINNNNFNTINTESTKNTNTTFTIKNKSVINLNNSMEQQKEKTGVKPNFTLFYNFNKKNNNNQNKNNEEETDNNSYVENIRNKYTFTQMKNNLKKDLSLRKKRCNDKYFHINNLKSLYKLVSCATTIQNIKGGSIPKTKISKENKENKENNKYSQKKLLSNININSEDDMNKNNNNNNLYYIKSNSKENIKQRELKLENIDNNKIRYNKVIITDNFHSKEKNRTK